MVQLQFLSKILQEGSLEIVEKNFLTEEYFSEYLDEFRFIQDHVREYGNVPDKATFLSKFSDIELVEVNETERYLVDTIREEHLYQKSVPIVQEFANLLKTNSNDAAEYMISHLQELQPQYGFGGTDIIAQAEKRLIQYRDRRDNKNMFFFESGFKELDEYIHGIQRGEEFLVILARSNVGKTWVLEKMSVHVWGLGFNVGFIEPEMSSESVGFRFDTLLSHYSNSSLMYGKSDVDEKDYADYINELKQKPNSFLVMTKKDFGGDITVSKIKQWITSKKLDLVAIDGLTYLSDERGRRGDNESTTLANVSADLMDLSVELKIPVLTVVQANRTGVLHDDEDGAPEPESVRGSDGILFSASKLLSLRQRTDKTTKETSIEIWIKKSRFGHVGKKVCYSWDINTGTFTFTQSDESRERRRQPAQQDGKSGNETKRNADVF